MSFPIAVCLCFLCGCSCVLYAATIVRTTAPVNPVEEGAILSVHCEVFNLKADHQVVLYRTRSGQTATLSYGEGVSHDVDERVFLAVRQQIDGSTVYFLSIMEVTRQEGGQYFCKVLNVADAVPSRMPVSPISINVTYFPSDFDPVCSPKEPPVVNAGDVITLNCSSEKANPGVSIRWVRAGSEEPLQATQSDLGDGRIYSVLKLTVRPSDSKAVFLCGIASSAFPGRKPNCHIGPLVVSVTKRDDYLSEAGVNETPVLASDPRYPKPKQNDNFVTATECNDFCSTSDTSLLYWVISTCVAGILAFVFLIIGILLFIKLSRLPSTLAETYISTRQPVDKIYDELETRRHEQSMYMSLDKARKVELHNVYPTCES